MRWFFGLGVMVALVGCPKRRDEARDAGPSAAQGQGTSLHTGGALGVPRVDIAQDDAGATRLQIGAARVQLPAERPMPSESDGP